MGFDDYQQYVCICPQCGNEHLQMLEKAHGDNPSAWRKEGKLVILCVKCRNTIKAIRNTLQGGKR